MGYFILGLLMGGTCIGLLLWLASGLFQPLPEVARTVAIVAVLGLAMLIDWGVLKLALPQREEQVSRETVRDAGPSSMFRFGFELGLGFRTFVTAAVPYSLAVAIMLFVHDPLPAMAIGASFGLGRALLAIVRYGKYGQTDPRGTGWKSLRSVKRYCVSLSAMSVIVVLT
ncbi:MAG: hypothetical protein ACRDU5_12075 [Mycobacterium sp.]